jgi:hypothetical protein
MLASPLRAFVRWMSAGTRPVLSRCGAIKRIFVLDEVKHWLKGVPGGAR